MARWFHRELRVGRFELAVTAFDDGYLRLGLQAGVVPEERLAWLHVGLPIWRVDVEASLGRLERLADFYAKRDGAAT